MKLVIQGAVLGGAIFVADLLYRNLVEPRLPANLQASNPANTQGFGLDDALYLTFVGTAAASVAVFAGKLIGQDNVPVKPSAAVTG